MKNSLYSLIVVIVMATAMTSCKNDDNNSPSPSATLNSNLQTGTWRITLFAEDGDNQTSHYSGYNFTFSNGGVVTATNGSNTVTGVWVTGSDDSTPKLILTFTAAPFTELNEDWRVLEQSSTKIRLQHISGGNGGVDDLVFEKI
jgi:hypothetical protein